MEIQFLNNKSINKKAWDECLHNAPGFELYMQSSYLDVVFPDWSALVVGDYLAVFPVFEKKILRWKLLRQPLFTGPCFVTGTDSAAVHKLTIYLSDFLKSYHYIDFNFSNALPELDSSTKIITRKLQQLKISNEGFSLSNGLKRNQKKASVAGIDTISEIDTREYILGIEKHLLSQHKVLNKKGLNLLRKVIDQKDLYGGVCVGIKNSDGITASAQFFLKGINKIYVILSYSTPEGRKNSGLHALQIQLINQHLSAGGTLHFGGSNLERIAEYNYNYGAKDYFYQRIVRKNFPFNFL